MESLSITSKKVLAFYSSNPELNPTYINECVIDMLGNTFFSPHKHIDKFDTIHSPNYPTTTTTTTTPKTDTTDSTTLSVSQRIIQNNNCVTGEIDFHQILNKLNPTLEIVEVTDSAIHADFIIKNPDKTDIVIEHKMNLTNISSVVVTDFIDTCKRTKSHGICISQHSGIVGKKNFEVDFIENIIIIYISNLNFNASTIEIALDVIDKLSDKLKIINTDSHVTISNTVLNEIKEEYQGFTHKKEELHNYIKNTHGQIINKLSNMTLHNTGEFLTSKFTEVDIPKKYNCSLCNMYASNTLKGMAAHKRGCKKKINNQ